MLKSGVNYKHDNVLVNTSRIMALSLSCPGTRSCPVNKLQKTLRCGKKQSIKSININYVYWVTGKPFHKLQILEV